MTTAIHSKLKNGKEGTIFKTENIVKTNCIVCNKTILENETVFQADGLHDCCSLEHAVNYLNDNIDTIIWHWPL
jgi:hypothetical protein